MDLDELIGKLRDVRSNFPGCKVVIATSRQVAGTDPLPGMVDFIRVPIAAASRLGDESGEIDNLFLVTVREV